jgi:uncharacterized protein DUF3147
MAARDGAVRSPAHPPNTVERTASMILELLVRFVVGGALVAVFALLGETFSPKTFSGLFAAAPSIALATLALAVHKQGGRYAAIEARSMIAGAVAFAIYASSVSLLLHRRRWPPTRTALAALPLWAAAATAAWALFLRAP